LVVMILLAGLIPWISLKPCISGDDLFLVLYMFALSRFFAILGSLDAGSAFGAFAASREATLSFLVEPASMLALVSLGIVSKSSSLSTIFSFDASHSPGSVVWLMAGCAIFIASLVELSRMPIDDPTTHLELTMVHEAMILEASGRNLALIEYAHALKMTVLLGMVAQCFMHAVPKSYGLSTSALAGFSFAGILIMAAVIGVIEGLTVKLRWRRAPEFIAYSLTMSFLACLVSIGEGAIFK